MPLQSVDFSGCRSLTPERREFLNQRTRQVLDVYDGLVETFGVPDQELDVVFTDSYAETVTETVRELVPQIPPYDPIRSSTIAIARCVPLAHDWSRVRVVCHAEAFGGLDSAGDARAIYLLAHELAHPMMSIVQRSIGALEDQDYGLSYGEMAAYDARGLAEEYRADTLAETVTRLWMTATLPDGTQRPAHYWDMEGPALEGAAIEALQRASDRWPVLLDDYRCRRMDLETMVRALTRGLDDVLTVLVHLQSAVDALEDNRGGHTVLSRQPLQDLHAVAAYLGDPCDELMEVIRRVPPMFGPKEAPQIDAEVVSAGAHAFPAMWSSQGFSFRDLPDGRTYIDVPLPRD